MKKRIALAAVAALAGGLLVAAPASAAVYNAAFVFDNVVSQSSGAGTSGVETATATQYSGVNNYATVSDVNFTGVPAAGSNEYYLTISGSTFNSVAKNGVTLNGAGTVASIDTNAAVSVNVATPSNGTITVTLVNRTWVAGVATDTTLEVMTLTVSTTPAALAYNHTTVDAVDLSDANVDTYVSGSDLFAYKGVSSTGSNWDNYVGWWDFHQYTSTDTSAVAADSLAKAVVVSLTGPGLIEGYSNGSGWTAGSYIVLSGDSESYFQLYADGRSGVSTITVTVNGVLVKTIKVTFFGDVATYDVSISKAQIQDGQTAILTVVKKDANGIAVPGFGGSIYTSSDETATLSGRQEYVIGTDTYTVGQDSAGKFAAKIVIGNGVIETKTVVANFVTAGAKTVTLTGDKASYAPGEKGTFSLTVKNSDGVVAGDGTYTLTLGGSAALYSAPATVTVKNGAATFTGYLPVLQGPVVLTATLTGADATASDAATLNLSVVDPAAVAQAAAITALQTSVATLTTTVASLVASMTAQIKVINATMLKIQKALAALAKKVK